ncbi:MAG: hypothetical protein ACFCD0_28855 [Gemmataceae bacterium]
MHNVEMWLNVVALVGFILGALALYWARGSADTPRVKLGQWIFVMSFLLLTMGIIVAASCRAESLTPLGIGAGLLIVCGVWDSSDTRAEKLADNT